MSVSSYNQMIREIIEPLEAAPLIEDIRIYTNWVLVKTVQWSLSTVFHGMPGFDDPPGMSSWMGDWLGRPAKAAALELLSSRFILHRAVGMATLKSLLPLPGQAIPGNATALVEKAAARVPTCFIGFFKEAALWREMGRPVNIVELFPRPGDIHWEDADEVLDQAQIVLMSGLTVVNETLEAVIRRTPNARVRIMMGPTVPPSPVLFQGGLDLLGVSLVKEMPLMARYAELGGGSIAYSPQGALERINLVRDPADLERKLAALASAPKP
nr:DUF364 domain-containing protein [uncultured Holophaga sp.]